MIRQTQMKTTSCNSKCAFYNYLSTHRSTRVHPSKIRDVDLARQVARSQGPTDLTASQHSAF